MSQHVPATLFGSTAKAPTKAAPASKRAKVASLLYAIAFRAARLGGKKDFALGAAAQAICAETQAGGKTAPKLETAASGYIGKSSTARF